MSSHPKVLAAVSLAAMAAFLASAQDWTPISGFNYWSCLASTADGARLFAGGGNLFTSTNFGNTWTLIGSPTNYWSSVACSADGSVIIGIEYRLGDLFVSTNFGAAWTDAFSPPGHYWNYWNSVACSADGKMMAAASGGIQASTNAVYISTNYGVAWIRTSAPSGTGQLAMSADGSRLAIAAFPAVYASTNFGLTWTTNHPPSELMYPAFIATAGAGTTLMALSVSTNYSSPGLISISSDWGNTWRPVGALTNFLYDSADCSAACSADGLTLAVAESSGNGAYLLLSTNSGASWSITEAGGPTNICSVVCSADGSQVAAALAHASFLGGASFYVRQVTPVPLLTVSFRGASLELSWLLPSQPFVLQESPDMVSWSPVNVTPVLNYSNLNYVVNLSMPVGPKFYRLASPR